MQCRENCSFSKHGGNSIDGWATKRTLFRGEAADLAARARATTSRCDGNSNRGGEEGDGHVQPRVRGVRERGFASPEKATNIYTRGSTWHYPEFSDDKCFSTGSTGSSTCSRSATRFRGLYSEAPSRRPRPICSRTTSSTPSRLAHARRRAFDRPLARASLLQKSNEK